MANDQFRSVRGSGDSLDAASSLQPGTNTQNRCLARLDKFGLPVGLARPITAWRMRAAELCSRLVTDMEDELIEIYAQECHLMIPRGEGLRFVLTEELLEVVDALSESVADSMDIVAISESSVTAMDCTSRPTQRAESAVRSTEVVVPDAIRAERVVGDIALDKPFYGSSQSLSDGIVSEPSTPTISPGKFTGKLHHEKAGWVNASSWMPQNSPPKGKHAAPKVRASPAKSSKPDPARRSEPNLPHIGRPEPSGAKRAAVPRSQGRAARASSTSAAFSPARTAHKPEVASQRHVAAQTRQCDASLWPSTPLPNARARADPTRTSPGCVGELGNQRLRDTHYADQFPLTPLAQGHLHAAENKGAAMKVSRPRSAPQPRGRAAAALGSVGTKTVAGKANAKPNASRALRGGAAAGATGLIVQDKRSQSDVRLTRRTVRDVEPRATTPRNGAPGAARLGATTVSSRAKVRTTGRASAAKSGPANRAGGLVVVDRADDGTGRGGRSRVRTESLWSTAAQGNTLARQRLARARPSTAPATSRAPQGVRFGGQRVGQRVTSGRVDGLPRMEPGIVRRPTVRPVVAAASSGLRRMA